MADYLKPPHVDGAVTGLKGINSANFVKISILFCRKMFTLSQSSMRLPQLDTPEIEVERGGVGIINLDFFLLLIKKINRLPSSFVH